MMPNPAPSTSFAIPPPSGSPPISRPPIDTNDTPKEASKISDWKEKEMDVDDAPSQYLSLAIVADEKNQAQQMDEEPESIYLCGLDILELEQVCKKKDYDKIPEHQISTLEVIISRAYQ